MGFTYVRPCTGKDWSLEIDGSFSFAFALLADFVDAHFLVP